MSHFLPLCLLLVGFSSLGQEKVQKNQPRVSSKCQAPSSPLFSKSQNLFIFISFSVPLETWKEYSYLLEKTEGVFVLRGLPENSFPLLSQKIQSLREEKIFASIQIDPEAFEKYAIDAIPSIVLTEDSQYDKMTGNISLSHALKVFSENGNAASSAKTHLKMLEEL